MHETSISRFAPPGRQPESAPAVLSDRRVLEHLRLADVHASLGADELREARLVALLAWVDARRTVAFSGRPLPEADLALEVDDLGTRAGLSAAQAEHARERLVAAGVLRRAGQGRFRFAAGVLDPAPEIPDAPDWGRVVERLAGDAAALLVAWAMGELLRHPARWNTVSNQELCRYTGYSRGMVIRGTQTAVERGVLERGVQNGRKSEYRFSPYALARGGEPARADLPGVKPQPSAAPEPARAAAAPPAPAPPAAAAEGMVRMQIGGIPIEVPPGTPVRLEQDAAGRPCFRIGEHWVIGPL